MAGMFADFVRKHSKTSSSVKPYREHEDDFDSCAAPDVDRIGHDLSQMSGSRSEHCRPSQGWKPPDAAAGGAGLLNRSRSETWRLPSKSTCDLGAAESVCRTRTEGAPGGGVAGPLHPYSEEEFKHVCRYVVRSSLEEIMKSGDGGLADEEFVEEGVVETEVGVGISNCTLVFEDESFEMLYCVRVAQQLRHTMAYCYVVVMLYSAYSLYGSLFSGDKMLVLRWNSPPNIAYNMYWIATLLATCLLLLGGCLRRLDCYCKVLTREWRVALFLSFLLWLRCFLGNRYRVAWLFNTDPRDAFGVSDGGDDELLMHAITLVIYLAMYTHMRFKLMLLPGLSAVFSYPVTTFLSSVVADDINDCDRDVASRITNSAMLATAVAFAFMGQRQIEIMRRRAFLKQIERETVRRAVRLKEESIRQKNMESHQKKQAQLSIFNEVDGRAANFGKSSSGLPPTPKAKDSGKRLLLSTALPPGATTDWQALEEAVTRIRDPDYSLREFHNHMVTAFPELTLYVFKPGRPADDQAEDPFELRARTTSGCSEEVLSSGRTRSEELARTFGAFYALYWLIRWDMDGRQGFCFGYDEDWTMRPILDGPPPEELRGMAFASMACNEKKLNFYHNFPWSECDKLLRDARIIQHGAGDARIIQPPHDPRRCGQSDAAAMINSAPGPDPADAPTTVVDRGRLRAMLVLTAFHDVMKNEALCPEVQPGHAPFRGYAEGQVIHDHDIALDYVLTFFGELLPSYSGLDEQSQRVVRFTQGKMGFNNGWLVQGESPPGALFTTFKQLIESGGAHHEDVAFYFAHWVTDLAGAEPTPLAGSVKFVHGFPHFVLASFFRSFAYVHCLSERTETQVLQEYLQAQWLADAGLGPVPVGCESVALMRLALQVQGNAELVRPALESLEPRDHETLCDEMARTGLAGQSYEGLVPRPGHPALLVYYGPAFLQRNGDRLRDALHILAEVYRQGRMLYPLETSDSDGGDGHIHTVTLRIEQLKDLSIAEAVAARTSADAEGFFLVWKSDLVAVVERHPLSVISRFTSAATRCCFLNWSIAPPNMPSPSATPIHFPSSATPTSAPSPSHLRKSMTLPLPEPIRRRPDRCPSSQSRGSG